MAHRHHKLLIFIETLLRHPLFASALHFYIYKICVTKCNEILCKVNTFFHISPYFYATFLTFSLKNGLFYVFIDFFTLFFRISKHENVCLTL